MRVRRNRQMTPTAFKKQVWGYYQKHGRKLPWRATKNPYRILVSEIMLQQTQVDRVVPKYRSFIKCFPTVRALAQAPLRDVLYEWQGLGYNRRGKMLWECAKRIVQEHNGRVPKNIHGLEALSGIGPYTARAVMAFAHNEPSVFIETNIRSVFIHAFFNDRESVSDKELIPYIEKTLDQKNPREWYFALMDYGAKLKREGRNPSQRSAHHTKQSRFKGSDREIRGAIIRLLVGKGKINTEVLLKELSRFDQKRAVAQLNVLANEGLVIQTAKMVRIA